MNWDIGFWALDPLGIPTILPGSPGPASSVSGPCSPFGRLVLPEAPSTPVAQHCMGPPADGQMTSASFLGRLYI